MCWGVRLGQGDFGEPVGTRLISLYLGWSKDHMVQ